MKCKAMIGNNSNIPRICSYLIVTLMALFFWWASFPTIAAELNLDARENPVSQDQSEIGIELGIFTLLGADFQLYYRLSESPWLYGYKYAKWTEENPSGITVPYETTTTITGPFVRYLFNPRAEQTWYLGASLLRRSQEVTCQEFDYLVNSDKDTNTGLYIGGGIMGWRTKSIYYNIGLLTSLGSSVKSSLDTGCVSEEGSGESDVNAAFGFVF